jgi:hypothetical protein
MKYRIGRSLHAKEGKKQKQGQVRVPNGHRVFPHYPIDLPMTLGNRTDEENILEKSNGPWTH